MDWQTLTIKAVRIEHEPKMTGTVFYYSPVISLSIKQ